MPRIGILRPAARPDARIADAVREAGGTPLALEHGEALPELAALVIPGGGDFPPPAPYPPGVAFSPVPPEQLASDLALLHAALERGLAVLGICYGMQLLAHAAGGRFVYDIEAECAAAGPHRLPEPGGRHPIEVAPGSRLARLLGGTTLAVNSTHHQAVAEPGTGLRVVARAPDGIVEAIESSDPARFVLGVQWHPERMEAEHRAALFGGLLGGRP
jgi:putative glutamine amidotransferase